ncbi:MAG: MFS transporter [Candidatus Aminicenantes bacterium]|nr:MFS transporter [Candidatus Aminicenantes bacterium]
MKKRILFSASLFHFINDASAVTVPMIFPLLYSQQLLIQKYSHIGILSYLGLMTTFVFQSIAANLSDKLEYKHWVLVSYIGICVSLFLITFTSAFTVFLFVYLVFRMFTSFYHPVGVAWISKTHPGQKVDFAMGVQSGTGNLGVLIAFISVGYLAQNFNWKLPLLAWALAGFLLGTASFASAKKTHTRSKQFSNPDFSSWMSTLKAIRVYILAFVFGGACWGTTVYYAPSLLNHKFQVPMGKTGLYLGFWIGLGIVTNYLFGYLSQRFGRFKIAIFGFLGSSLFLFFLGTAGNSALAVMSLLCFGAFLFLIYPAFNSFVGNVVPAENQSQAFSITANTQVLTGAVVSLANGFLSDRFGISSPFFLLGILGILVSGFFLAKKPRLQPNKKD